MTIYDVAKKAGVSIATVSRVINESDLVTEKTRKKVESVMNEIGYRPNIFARGLVTDTVKTIGVVSVDIRDSYYSEVVYNINREMRRMGYGVVITNTEPQKSDVKRELNFLIDRRVDGIMLVGSVFADKEYSSLIKDIAQNVPIAAINAKISLENVFCTVCDDAFGTYELMEAIHKKGKNKPIYICDNDSQSTMHKIKGYKKAMREIFFKRAEVIHCGDSADAAADVIELIKLRGCDCAVFSNDMLAAGFVCRAVQLGIKVPDEIGMAGYDNLLFATVTTPPLTTVDSRQDEISRVASRTLVNVIEGGSGKVQKLNMIKPLPVMRESI